MRYRSWRHIGLRGIILVAISLLILLPTHPSEARPSASEGNRAVASLDSAVVSPFGVEATGWGVLDPAGLASGVASTHAQWTRINQLRWSVAQPTANSPCDWSSYDAAMLAAAGPNKELIPIVIIGDTPTWAAANPSLPSGPIAAAHLSAFTQCVQAAVQRYSQPDYNIKYWEFFNEPDETTGAYRPWISTWGYDGAGYAAMLKSVYPAVKAKDPQAKVIFGSIAFDNFTTDGGVFNRQFIDDVFNAGGGPYFDIFGFHYYSIFAPTWNAYGIDILGKTNFLRSKLAAYGMGDKPMICTEIGHFGSPGNSAEMAQQADYVPQVYARGMSGGLQNMIWYSLNNGTDNTGLLNNGAPKPAFEAYQVAADELGQTRFVRPLAGTDVHLSGAPAQAFEGYLFQDAATSQYRAVVWMNSGSAIITIPGSSLDTIDIHGNRVTRPGTNGRISIPLNQSPLYLDLSSYPWNFVYLPYVPR